MRMAADHNWNIYPGGNFPQSFCNQNVVSFQSGGTVNNTTGYLGSGGMNSSSGGMNSPSGGMNSPGSIGSTAGMILPRNPGFVNNSSSLMPPGTSSGGVGMEPVHAHKHGTSLAVDWTYQELLLLKEGLARYANESNIMKYIKISAMLRDKTVRDVALRCRWMTKKENGKRRRQEDYFAGKKMKDRKDKMVDTSSMANMISVQPENSAACSFSMPESYQINQFAEVPVIDDGTWPLLNENIGLLEIISSNLNSNKVQENIDLFYRIRHNIINILNSMSMSKMPALPVSLDENLVYSLLCLNSSQVLGPGSIHSHSDEETRGW